MNTHRTSSDLYDERQNWQISLQEERESYVESYGDKAMTVAELIEILEQFDGDMEVRLAQQPHYPFENEIGDVVEADNVVYIGESTQLGYLPSDARYELGW